MQQPEISIHPLIGRLRWNYFSNPRMFAEYGRQKGWERENPATDSGNPSEKTMDGFVEVTEQMELPF